MNIPPKWNAITSVCLDMDGTLLDLYFDNHFWTEYVPNVYAIENNLEIKDSKQKLFALYAQQKGHLNWYCLDFWSEQLNLNITELKQSLAHGICLRDNAIPFLEYVKILGKDLYLVTNAHRDSMTLKLNQTGLAPYFDKLISAHDYGIAKEQRGFWKNLSKQLKMDLTSTLFIDDSESVLNAAKSSGVGHILAIYQPDSQQPAQSIEGFTHLHNFSDMMKTINS